MREEEIRELVGREVARALSGPARQAARAEIAWGAAGIGFDMQRGAEEYAGKGSTQDNAPGAAGEAGKRTFDAWTWRHTGSGTISVGNILVGLRGIVAEYSGASLSVGTSGTYVYANITWTLDDDGNVTAITSVELETTTSFSDAAKELTDGDGKQTGLHVPLGLFKSASGTWGTTVVCVRRYFGGALMLHPDVDAAGWTCDTFRTAEDFDQKSVETVDAAGTDSNGKKFARYLQLRNFEIGDDGAVLNAADAGWTDPTTGKTSEKLLVRKVIAEGQVRLQYKSHNPMPDGDSTDAAAMWDDTKGGWVKALPVEATNDEQSAEVGAGGRVVVGAKTGTTGNLIQLITQPLGDQGGKVPPGYADGTVIVDMQWYSSGKKVQIKTATALVKTGTTSAWTDKITFASFAD